MNNIGKRFGRLIIIKKTRLQDKREAYICLCDCGNKKIIRKTHLLNGNTISCGCYFKEISTKHGLRKKSIYNIWANIKQRCLNINGSGYKDYGGRGIKICKEWEKSFINFYKDMGDRPEGKTLDRIDNDGDYCKENCRWVDRKTQNRNSRHARKIKYNGEIRCLTEWAEELNINYHTLCHRFYVLKWPIKKCVKKALTT